MKQQIVAFTGISGVGKTAFLTRLSQQVDFQHITGGSLISAAQKTTPENRDTLRYSDLEENQRLLVAGFALKRDLNAKIIVMDGHVVIDDGRRLSKISPQVFKALGISMMVHLEAEPERIAANRRKDESRSRPVYTIEILKMHQSFSSAHAMTIAETLCIPFKIVKDNEDYLLAELLDVC